MMVLEEGLANPDGIMVKGLEFFPEPVILGIRIADPIGHWMLGPDRVDCRFGGFLGIREDLGQFQTEVRAAYDPLPALKTTQSRMNCLKVALGDHPCKSVRVRQVHTVT